MGSILRTAELHAGSDCEAGTVFERARAGDTLVDAVGHIPVVVRLVLEHLLRKRDLRHGGNLCSIEIESELVNLHVLP